MKATFFAVSTLSVVSSVASARVINRARSAETVTATSAVGKPVQATPTASARNGFELDVTTSKLGEQNLFSREDEFIHVSIAEDDVLEKATLRSVKDDVTCTVKDIYGFQVRKFGGEHPDSIELSEFEGQHAYTIGCFFDGEEHDIATYQTPASGASKKEARQESTARNGFELDITYAKAGLKDFYSRDDDFISEAFLAGDEVTRATVRSVKNDVTCTIKDVYGFQVRKFGSEHPESIELSAYESKMARTVGCFFDGDEVKDTFNYKSPAQ